MNYKALIWSLVGVCILLVIFIVYQFAKPVVYSAAENLTCEKLIYNGDIDKKINIVFLTRGLKKEDLNKSIAYFLETAPYSSNKDKFNFFYVDYSPECSIESSALLCYSRDLIKKSSVCPNDYIIVVSKENYNIRSSAYLNVVSINSALPSSVFIHEFGHVFANLADEYIPAKIPWGAKNCPSGCESFKDSEGCFKGCSDDSHYRSSYASVMRTLSSNSYGKFNENLIKEDLAGY